MAEATPMMLAYGSTGSGHSGNATSIERAQYADASGLTGKRQRATYELVKQAGSEGITCGELENRMAWGHGIASSALTHLHRAGFIMRLQHRRMKQELYVLPDFRNNREESPYRPRMDRQHPKFLTREQVLAAMMDAQVDESFYPEVRRVIEALP
jgi:hypothetical protein